MPKLKMMDGTEMPLEEVEVTKIKETLVRQDAKWVHIKGSLINASSISGIYPDDIVRGEVTQGRLHDGSRVVKKFGLWVDADHPEVSISASHYPEVARDL